MVHSPLAARRAQQAAALGRLLAAVGAGDTRAANAERWYLVMGLRKLIAHQIRARSDIHREECEQAAILYLVDRIHKWRPAIGALSTFATIVMRTFLDRCGDLTLSVPQVQVPRIYNPAARLRRRGATMDEITTRLKRSEDTINALFSLRESSLQSIALDSTGRRMIPLCELIADTAGTPADTRIEALDRIEVIQAALAAMPRRRRTILRRYYGLGCRQETGPQIARRYGVTRQCINQTVQQAKRELKTIIKEYPC